ncbi:MAG: hypothetical protein II928_04445 [Paludibacteraceae bacterium]|nr:hypothetical protein [Paludibacteraceae bacterium]
MKKILFAAVLAFASVMAYAQPRAIGVRLGEFDGVSYQHGFGESSMLEIEAGFNWGNYWGNRMVGWEDGNQWHMWGHNVQLAATYDWIDPFGATFPWEHKGEWHWYLGVGVAGGFGWAGYTRVAGEAVGADGNWGFVGGVGRAGVEYDFWFPLQLSIDYRPTLGAGLVDAGALGTQAGFYYDVLGLCLSARYKF